MMKRTHLASGLLLASVFPRNAVLLIIGSLLPDLDIKFLHRALLHNIFFFLLTMAYSPFLAMGVLAHILLDSLTVQGVEIFFPLDRTNYGLKITTTGSFLDHLLFFLFLFGAVYLSGVV